MKDLCVSIVAKKHSERLPYKNRIKISDKYNMMVNYDMCLKYCDYADMFLYSDDEVLVSEASKYGINIIPRETAKEDLFASHILHSLLPNFSKYKKLLAIYCNDIYIDKNYIDKLVDKIYMGHTAVLPILKPFLCYPEYAVRLDGEKIDCSTTAPATEIGKWYLTYGGGEAFDLNHLRNLNPNIDNIYGDYTGYIEVQFQDCIHVDYESDLRLALTLLDKR